jgi:CRISPR-associated protein (TIGR02710 family)
MLVLGTEESFRQDPSVSEPPLDRIRRLAGVPNIEWHLVPAEGEVEIYRHIRDFVRRHGADPRQVAVDPTGGKKSMSVSAGLAGFLAQCPIVYVDYAEYADRIPLAGTEFPRLLANPLEVMGDVEFERIEAAFNRGDFSEALHRARELEPRLANPRRVQALAALAEAYGAWSAFRFDAARPALVRARDLIERFARLEAWDLADTFRVTANTHLGLLERLERLLLARGEDAGVEDLMPLVHNHLAAGRRAHREGRYGIAVLLAYSSVERYVDVVLRANHGLDDESPDYDRVRAELQARIKDFHSAGRRLFGRKYRPVNVETLSGPITFAAGLQLLATLEPQRVPSELLPRMLGLMTARNKSEYAHGIHAGSLGPNDAARHLRHAEALVAYHYAPGNEGLARLDAILEEYVFPRLGPTPPR